MSSRVIETRSGVRRLPVRLGQELGEDGIVAALIVGVVEVEVGGVVEVEEEEEAAAMWQTLPRNEHGRTRIRRVGGTIIGRGDMIKR